MKCKTSNIERQFREMIMCLYTKTQNVQRAAKMFAGKSLRFLGLCVEESEDCLKLCGTPL